jgi:hypothetical protein
MVLFQFQHSAASFCTGIQKIFAHPVCLMTYRGGILCKANFSLSLIKHHFINTKGHAVAHLVEALRYKPESRGYDSR